MFAFTKVVKLIGLFVRNPSDIMFLPVSIIFGYFHGLIKLNALLTLKMVGASCQCPMFVVLTYDHRRPGVVVLTVTSTTTSDSRSDLSAA